ncbi:MAG: DNA primase [Ruminococcaceae bacterium]|nr:DNA primase [Oscillospiraceae bacterium]
MIDQGIISDIKYRNPIEDVISGYVSLKRAGSNMNGLCPFHSERTPSFTVFSSSQNFYCFGCGAGGDVITFIMKAENLDYISAIKFLGKRVGIEINDEEAQKGEASRTRILAMNKSAAKFFHTCLMESDNNPGIRYLRDKRGFTNQQIVHFGLGYAKDGWDNLTKHLKGQGYSDEEMKTAFLSSKSQKTGRSFDYFRNRVMIPIIDMTGNIIAFGGRILTDEQPKYMNTSDTPVFKKSRNLFAMNFAKNTCADKLILCEGYMDVIALHGAGFTNSVATLGTAITPEHARLMKRYTKSVLISYDSDSAGQNAADKAFRLLSEVGLEARVLDMGDIKDPDEFIRKRGKEEFRKLLEGTKNRFEFKFNAIKARHNLNTTDGRVKAAAETVAVLAEFPSSVERTIYAGNAAKVLGVNQETLLYDAEKYMKKSDKKKSSEEKQKMMIRSGGYGDTVNPDYVKNPAAAAAEEAIIGMMLLRTELVGEIKKIEGFGAESFFTEFNRRVYEFIIKSYEEGNGVFDEGCLSRSFSDAEVGRVVKMKIRRMELSDNGINTLKECVERLMDATSVKSGNSIEDLEELIKNKRRKNQ